MINTNSKSTGGILYIVATPIGNLEDFSYRAIETLKNVSLILAEDTRKFGILKKRYGIETHATSLFEHNESTKIEAILRRLAEGCDLALVSDAGTPLISDPGYRLVSECRARGFRISPIPGASSVTSALSVSGLETDKFMYIGFLPVKQGKKKSTLDEFCRLPATIVLFESPHRLLKTLNLISELFPHRKVVVCRELTKIYEEVLSGTASDIISVLSKRSSIKGEIVVLISKSNIDNNIEGLELE